MPISPYKLFQAGASINRPDGAMVDLLVESATDW